MSTTNVLIVGGIEFPVMNAVYGIGNGEFDIDVECEKPMLAPDGHRWRFREPRLYSQGVALPDSYEAGSTFLISSAKEHAPDDDDEAPFALYMFEHEPVTEYRGSIVIVGANHRFELEGKAEVMGNPYPFKLSTTMVRRT